MIQWNQTQSRSRSVSRPRASSAKSVRPKPGTAERHDLLRRSDNKFSLSTNEPRVFQLPREAGKGAGAWKGESGGRGMYVLYSR